MASKLLPLAAQGAESMRYIALACDYDGTLAHDGSVEANTIAALERLRASGRKLVLVTGREMDDLVRVFPSLALFDRVVAENGGVIYDPAQQQTEPLAPPPSGDFVRELQRLDVHPLSIGHVIVATWQPHEDTVLRVIRDLNLELQVIFNKGAVMVLPSGINKATGLRKAADRLKLSLHNIVSVGDAENDHAFLAASGCGVAVANALESIKVRADLVTAADHGAGVVELIDRLIATDLAELAPRLTRHRVEIGRTDRGTEVHLHPYTGAVLVAGPSGSGKSTLITAVLEHLCDAGHQFCVVDPEGDYQELAGAIALRGGDARALADDALHVVDRPGESVVASLLDLRLDDRPAFLQRLLPRLLELRAATARPHWIIVDEAHHLLPSTWQPSETVLPGQLDNVIFVTVHPDHVARAALDLVRTVLLVGRDPQATIEAFTRTRVESSIALPGEAESGDAWIIRPDSAPVRFHAAEPTRDKLRHRRKYAEGELGEDISFYFRGADGRLNLRAQNLEVFMQMAEGIDDGTWHFHLSNHDVSRWFRNVIKDASLADDVAALEERDDLSADDSRARVREAIERRYTKPT
jgi:hydroxymethylpyrimidine pyrophosphatase-like HAD family hydrolase/energy-coupling factor transporter ATP-binding protein EcfA2